MHGDWKNILLNNWWFKEETKEKSKHAFRQMKREINITRTGDEARAVIREKFMVINTYIKKKERTQINNIILYLKELGKKEQKKLKVSRKKEITKVRVERNKINA